MSSGANNNGFVPLREYRTFGRVQTWEEWRTATSDFLPDFIFPYIVCNVLGFLLLWLAIAFGRARFSRKAWGFLMILASIANSYVALTDPKGYQEYGVLAIPPIQHFIYSRFFSSPELLVIPIAVGQFVIGLILLLSEVPFQLKVALAGASIFFFGIASLGLGSAFPSSLVYATTMMVCWPKTPVAGRKYPLMRTTSRSKLD